MTQLLEEYAARVYADGPETLAGRPASTTTGSLATAAPQIMVRLVGVLLTLAVTAVHVADQGGITALAAPAWLGWAFRLTETGGVVIAVLMLIPAPNFGRLGWAAAVLLGLGPLTGYIASRTIGLPGDHMDVGNWGDWVGTVSLAVEAALVMFSVTMLLAHRNRSPAG